MSNVTASPPAAAADSIEVDMEDTPTPEETRAAAPPVAGVVAGTTIVSPLAALSAPPTVNGQPSTSQGRRGRSGGNYLARAIYCDFEPDKADSQENWSSKISDGQTQPGVYADTSYYNSYKTALAIVDSGRAHGVKWVGNGNLGRWRSPMFDAQGKPVLVDEIGPDGNPTGNKVQAIRLVECINPPAKVIELRQKEAQSEADSLARALRHQQQGLSAGTNATGTGTGRGGGRQRAAAETLTASEVEGAVLMEDQSLVVDMNAPAPPPAAPRRQPQATVGAPPTARPVQKPPEEPAAISLEEALAGMTAIHAPEGADLSTVPTDPNAVPPEDLPSTVGESFGLPPEEAVTSNASGQPETETSVPTPAVVDGSGEDATSASVVSSPETTQSVADAPEEQAPDLPTNIPPDAVEQVLSTDRADNEVAETLVDDTGSSTVEQGTLMAETAADSAENSETTGDEVVPEAASATAVAPRRSKRMS